MGRAKGSKKPRRKDHELESTSQRPEASAAVPATKGIEVLGVLMLVGSLFLCFALFSFDPGDGHSQTNLVGPLGVHLADALLGSIGVAGYIGALVLVAIAGAVIVGKRIRPSPIAVASSIGIMLSLTILAELVLAEATLFGHAPGGAIGVVLARILRTWAGPAGAGLIAAGVLMVGVLGVTDVSLGAALVDGHRLLRSIVLRLHGSVEARREAERAAAIREEEIVEAERSRRAQAKLEQEQRERELVESLEEKKRLAVLKATAKAEERALARIASLEAKERIESEAALEQDDIAEEDEPEGTDAPVSAADVLDAIDEEASFGREEAEPEIVALNIPGPGAEPPIEIGQDDLAEEDGDDSEEADEDEEDYVEDEAEEDDEPVGCELSTVDSGELSTVDSGDGITIHARKQSQPDMAAADEAPAPIVKQEKRVYQMPAINLLDYEGKPPEPIDGEALRAKATRLEEKLKTYGVEGRVTAIRPGPVVTTYEYQPAPGVKVAKIASLSDDIAMSMEAMRVRIVAPIPGRGVVGIELPNETRESVYLKELIAHESFKKSKSLLTLALGKDAEGEPQVRDLRSMPHFLIAGTTGSGKSVSVNAMILSILYKATPDQVKFIMVDPKMLELSLYEDIPHLLLPVVTDPRKASLALQWAVDEMERRYQMLSDLKVRDIDGFNKKLARLKEQREKEGPPSEIPSEAPAESSELPAPAAQEADKNRIKDPWPKQPLPEPLPYIVVLIDEFADLMCVAPRDVEASVQRLAQKARAAGIHVMLATQRPSTDVITGVIKNNFPSRISFRVASRHDSATILNAPGAENLLGMGDMLCLGVSSPQPVRIHGAFVSEEEVQRVVDFWKAQAKPTYDATILQKRSDDDGDGDDEPVEHDEMYDRAVQIVTETRKASISALQRRLRVGYNRAARMIEMMETEGLVGPASGPKGEREVLVRAIAADP
jgi:DNA segregation ATPase FtsK/SpoIIIE, S-DNA-T family